MKKNRRSLYFYIAILIGMVIIITYSLTMESFAIKFLPIVISGAVLVLAAFGLSKEIGSGSNPDETQIGSETSEGEEIKEDWKGYLFGGGYILGFSAGVYLLGFIMAIPLFILYYLKSHKTGWPATVLYAVLITSTIYGVFELGLDIILYRGVLFASIFE